MNSLYLGQVYRIRSKYCNLFHNNDIGIVCSVRILFIVEINMRVRAHVAVEMGKTIIVLRVVICVIEQIMCRSSTAAAGVNGILCLNANWL